MGSPAQVVAARTSLVGGLQEAKKAVAGDNPHSRSLQYRADVDGLRAIAVLLVLIFHGGLSIFPSGFIGVDIFFVISGYLTTAIILKAIDGGKFSFAEFYSRRIWRLQPAMLALFAVTAALAAYFYLPEDFTHFLKTEKYASMLISNQYFERSTTAYAAGDTSSLLLLHTWSLGIEWQWYLVLPLFLWLLRRYCSLAFFEGYLLGITVCLALASMYLSSQYPDKSYYFFTARIFELLIGSCAVIFGSKRLNLSLIWKNTLGLLAVGAIVYCALQENILRGFPDYHAVIVCLATAVLLSHAGSEGSVTSKALSFRPLVLIGTISYSLYLWHWPVLATASYLGFQHSTDMTIIYFVSTFVLATLSYVLIERKFRQPKLKLPLTVALLMVLPAIVISVAYSKSVANDGWPARFGSELTDQLTKLKSAEVPNRWKCLDGVSDGSDARCVIGSPAPKATALMIGDSFANQYWNFFDTMSKDADLSLLAQSEAACLALPGIFLYDWWESKDTIYQVCHDKVADYYELVRKNHYKYVILGQIWGSYAGGSIVTKLDDERSVELSHQRFEKAMREALDMIKASGAIPVFVKATFPMPPGVNECLSQRIAMRGMLGSNEVSQGCEKAVWDGLENAWLEGVFSQMKADYPNLILIDPKDVQCSDGQCLTMVDGAPVYRDIGHITDYASLMFGKEYLHRFGNPFKPVP